MTSENNSCPGHCNFKSHYDNIKICSNCGLGKTIEVTRKRDEQDYQQPTDEQAQKRLLYFHQFIKYDLKHIKAFGKSLDIGCADGLFLIELEKIGWNAYGLEPYRNLTDQNDNILNTSLENFTPPETFQLVTMIHSLEHIKNPVNALKKINGFMERNSYLLISVPNFDSYWAKIRKEHWPWLNKEEHYFHYTPASLCNLLTHQNFDILYYRTSSSEAPSLFNELLHRSGVFASNYPFKKWITRILYKIGLVLKKSINAVIDKNKKGAELIVLAKKVK